MQGEITGFVGSNVLDSHLQTEQVEMPAIASLNAGGIDSGAASNGGPKRINKGDMNHETNKYENHKCHQGTQTVLFVQPVIPNGVQHYRKSMRNLCKYKLHKQILSLC